MKTQFLKTLVLLFILFNATLLEAQEGAPPPDGAFSLLLCEDGLVQSSGANSFGQLGIGSSGASTSSFQTIPNLENIQQVATGGTHGLALDCEGQVWAWGLNNFGVLGLGNIGGSVSVPTQIPNLSNVVQVMTSTHFCLALLEDGSLRSWGRNHKGQLGNGTTLDSSSPVEVLGINDAIDIAVARGSAYALLSDGSVKSWGLNDDGELGIGTNDADPHPYPLSVSNLSEVTNIEAGASQAYAIHSSDLAVKSWGNNTAGELGVGSSSAFVSTPTAVLGLIGVKDIATGYDFANALLEDGNIMVWGSNGGDGSNFGVCDLSSSNVPIVGPEIADVVSLAYRPTGNNVFAIQSDGGVKVWGDNSAGQLGIGNTSSFCDFQTPLDICFAGALECPEEPIDTIPCIEEIAFTVEPTTSSLAGVGTVDDRPAYIVQSSGEWTFTSNPFVLSSLVFPGEPIYMDVDLVIPSGVSLNIEGMEISFAPDCRILIEKGGTLATTTYQGQPTVLGGICNTVWQGTQVEGPGEGILRGEDDGTGYFNYGIFYNHYTTIIQDAIIGLTGMKLPLMDIDALNLFSLADLSPTAGFPTLTSVYLQEYVNSPLAHQTAGGVVRTLQELTLENCFQGINLSWYVNKNIDSPAFVCEIDACKFLTDELPFPFSEIGANTQKSEVGIMLKHYDYLQIGNGNDGTNSFINHKYGIRAVEVTDIKIYNNVFEECKTGVSVFNGLGNPLDDSIRIIENSIEGSDIAIQACGVGGLMIEENMINVSTNLNSFKTIGLFLRACAFEVQYNDINNLALGAILLNNISPVSYLSSNNFSNAKIGVWSLGLNFPDVQISCNDFSDYLAAIVVQDDTQASPIQEGILSNQGNCNFFEAKVADNTFDFSSSFGEVLSFVDTPFTYFTRAGSAFIPTVNYPNLVIVEICPSASEYDLNCSYSGIMDDGDIEALDNEEDIIKETIKKTRHYVRNDDESSAISLLESIDHERINRMLIPHYIEQGQYTEAESLLDGMDQLSEEEMNIYNIYSLYKNVCQEGRALWEMNAAEEMMIREMASSTSGAKYDAQTILYLAYGEEFPIELPPLPGFLSDAIDDELNVIFKGQEDQNIRVSLLYPNPAKDKLFVDIYLDTNETVELVLYDLQGRLMYRQFIKDSGTKGISVSALASGIYYYHIDLEGESLEKGKIVITE